MKLLAPFILACCSSVALAQLPPHPAPQVTRNGDTCNLDWTGQNSITYFVQYSLDLQSWSYLPVIESGDGSAIGYGFECNTDKMFVRLHYTNIPTSNPNSDDFDGDGISNWDEVRVGGTGASPLKADTNGDGIRDDGLVYAAQSDPDGAGLSTAMQAGIIGRWDFEQLQLAPPALPYFPDKTGSTNHATANFGSSQELNDAIISKSCKIPNAGYLSAPATIMNGVKACNLSMWIKPTEGSLSGANATKSRTLWSYGDVQTSLPLLVLLLKNEDDIYLQRYTNGVLENIAVWNAPEKLDDGKWRHICFVREEGGPTGIRYKLYINGQQVGNAWGGQNSPFGNNPNGYFLIGHSQINNSLTQFDGLLDRVLLHNRALAQTEALELYRSDIDGDGLWDITEHKSHLWRDLNSNEIKDLNEFRYFIRPYYFDDANADHDGDGRTSLEEQNDTQHPTDLFNPDSDGDLLPDGWEVGNGLDPNDPNDGSETADADGDGATNREEYAYNSDPNNGVNGDTDGDGTSDSQEISQGSHPNDPTDNGQPLSDDEKLAIRIGVGDNSGSQSEDYVMNIYRLNPESGSEERFYTLRSGGHGEYDEIVLDIFKKSDSYTFQIDWQSSSSGTAPVGTEGPDFDYTFKVEPQNDATGILIDSYYPVVQYADTANPIGGDKNDVEDFQEKVETKRIARLAVDLDIVKPGTESNAKPTELSEKEEDFKAASGGNAASGGGVASLNWDDDDQDGGAGGHQQLNFVNDFNDENGTTKEDDLIQIKVHRVMEADVKGRLKFNANHFRIWKKKDRTEEIKTEDTEFAIKKNEDLILYVEGKKLTAAEAPEKIELQPDSVSYIAFVQN